MNKCPRKDLNRGPSRLKESALPSEQWTTDNLQELFMNHLTGSVSKLQPIIFVFTVCTQVLGWLCKFTWECQKQLRLTLGWISQGNLCPALAICALHPSFLHKFTLIWHHAFAPCIFSQILVRFTLYTVGPTFMKSRIRTWAWLDQASICWKSQTQSYNNSRGQAQWVDFHFDVVYLMATVLKIQWVWSSTKCFTFAEFYLMNENILS
jgi:hypothetical protein